MGGRVELRQHLSLAMRMVAVITLLLGFIAFDLIYALMLCLWPEMFPADFSPWFTGWDVLITLGVGLLAAWPASVLAIRVSRRIVAPLNSVAWAARQIAGGDLGARAQIDLETPGETRTLVEDFNAMAQRLETMARDKVVWNAQIAHELRTPVTVLKGRLQGVADGVFPMDDALVASLLTQVEGLRRLIEDLRGVSLAESGHLDLQPRPVDLAADIRDLAVLVEPGLTQAGFRLELALEEGAFHVDAARIRQALMALLDNAQLYADPGFLRVALRREGGCGVLMVANEGPGVPDATASQMFSLFVRGEGAVERHRMGSGLGLAVVQAIAKAHGGTVSYAHTVEGSRFTLTWPEPEH